MGWLNNKDKFTPPQNEEELKAAEEKLSRLMRYFTRTQKMHGDGWTLNDRQQFFREKVNPVLGAIQDWRKRHPVKGNPFKGPKVPMGECVKGRVYEIRCRNLLFGVYDGEGGFIGIRTKFGSRYLFTEYHWDKGPPFGTVMGHKDTGIDVGIEAVEGNEELFKLLEKIEEEHVREECEWCRRRL